MLKSLILSLNLLQEDWLKWLRLRLLRLCPYVYWLSVRVLLRADQYGMCGVQKLSYALGVHGLL